MDVEARPIVLNLFLLQQLYVLRHFRPALEVGDRSPVGCHYFKHASYRDLAHLFPAFHQRHRAFQTLHIQNLVISDRRLFHFSNLLS